MGAGRASEDAPVGEGEPGMEQRRHAFDVGRERAVWNVSVPVALAMAVTGLPRVRRSARLAPRHPGAVSRLWIQLRELSVVVATLDFGGRRPPSSGETFSAARRERSCVAVVHLGGGPHPRSLAICGEVVAEPPLRSFCSFCAPRGLAATVLP